MQMQYDRAKDALAFLNHHQLEPSATHYHLALTFLSGADPVLSRHIRSLIDDGLRLTADDAARLIGQMTGQGGDFTPARTQQALAGHAERLQSLADEASGVTQALGDDVRHVVRHASDTMPDGDGVVARLAKAERELAELKEQFAALRVAVQADTPAIPDQEHDGLTNALTQMGARRMLDQLGISNRRFVVLIFSIDGLVGINRDFGNSVGDNVLNAFASKLKTIFSDQEPIRWAGNEFVVVVPDRTVTAVRTLAEEVLTLIETRKFRLRGSGEWIGTITASAAIVPDQNESMDKILNRGREKLDNAIRQGGNRIEV